ncbi:hypothetical protein Ari01nite_19230 [Paractinoplanes rishiriensis]|uniref:Uncharacterized protein n=1 Tax=Paractinoplanes rishiriensis TaxID=1050105 RepID=A0A919JWK8_9ACTN|nr:hypothetical protein Ari01nite_19230 [Actinoplanes rishiriensis]
MTAAATRRLLGVSLAVLLVAVLAAVAVLVVRGRGDDPVTAPGSAPPAGPRGYAYTTATDLVVKLAGGTEFRQPGAYRGGALFYTRTGTFVVAAAVGTADDQVLTVVNTETRKVQHIGCSCASAAPVGGDRIAYVDTGTREAFVLDVFTGEAKPLALDLPGGRQATEVMAGGADSVLVRGQIIDPGQDAPDYGSPDVLYAVQVGRPAARKVAEHAMIVGSSAVGGTGPDGTPGSACTCRTTTGAATAARTGSTTAPPDARPSRRRSCRAPRTRRTPG